jgi:hypothetical protein
LKIAKTREPRRQSLVFVAGRRATPYHRARGRIMHTTTIIDDEDDGPPRLAGGRFYMTPEGQASLTAELHTSEPSNAPASSTSSPGPRATATGPRTAITFTANAAYGKSTGACAS